MAAALVFRRRFARYAVEGVSMMPALAPRDFVVVDRTAYAASLPRPGEIVLAADPTEPSRTLVKRVLTATPAGIELRGDNSEHSTDSRSFGLVPPESLLGRVRWRYWPRPGRLR
jgi:nickel-type superoxide dismutase maturation protease